MNPVFSLLKRLILLFCLLATGVTETRAADTVETSGTLLSVALPLVAVGMTLRNDDAQGRWQLAEAFVLTTGVTYGLKYSIDATRPNGGKHSFPSAHTSVSFAAADFIGRRYGWEYGIPAYAAAGFVGYSRVDARAHHRYDVVAGAALGILSDALFTSRFKEKGVKISALPLDDGATLQLSYAW
jgi:membrane-associated phospholipid phosphatase